MIYKREFFGLVVEVIKEPVTTFNFLYASLKQNKSDKIFIFYKNTQNKCLHHFKYLKIFYRKITDSREKTSIALWSLKKITLN